MDRDILPLGSVVTLKKGKQRLMIVGRFQEEASSGQLFEYSAVLWPVGMISSNQVYLFNGDDIDCVYFLGLQDSQEFTFRRHLLLEVENLNL
ncbi:MAG: DUF4176 domain-containing protein [Allobaculum sp.]|nr:DUF4176 domain-containing protein [Allobaculum sp.]